MQHPLFITCDSFTFYNVGFSLHLKGLYKPWFCLLPISFKNRVSCLSAHLQLYFPQFWLPLLCFVLKTLNKFQKRETLGGNTGNLQPFPLDSWAVQMCEGTRTEAPAQGPGRVPQVTQKEWILLCIVPFFRDFLVPQLLVSTAIPRD